MYLFNSVKQTIKFYVVLYIYQNQIYIFSFSLIICPYKFIEAAKIQATAERENFDQSFTWQKDNKRTGVKNNND